MTELDPRPYVLRPGSGDGLHGTPAPISIRTKDGADLLDDIESKYAPRGLPSASTATLRRTMQALTGYDDSAPATLRVVGLGSSVGAGATLPDPATQAPVARLGERLLPVLDRTGGVDWAISNGSVNGSVVFEGLNTHYAAAKTTAGGAPKILVLAYGMNDAAPATYHAGQTFPGFIDYARQLVDAAHADGADVILLTTPHPHSQRDNQAMPNGVPASYAGSGTGPSATLHPADPVVSVTSPSGDQVPANWRYLRVNEAIRRVADDTGSLLIDVEPYWFDAIAAYGEDALFDPQEIVHPNLFGHRQSYWAAIDAFVGSVQRAATQGVGAARAPFSKGEVIGGRLGLGPGGSVAITLPANTRGMLSVWGTSGGGWQSHTLTPAVTDSTRVGVAEPWGAFTAPGNLIAGLTTTGGSLDVTIQTTNTGGGSEIQWEYRY